MNILGHNLGHNIMCCLNNKKEPMPEIHSAFD